MTDKQVKDKFRYADGTNEQDNYENFINSFDVDDEVYYRGKHYIKFINEQLKAKEQENKKLKEDEKSLLNIIDDLQKEKNKWVEKYNDLGQDFDQLKQTLAEIKEIIHKSVIGGARQQILQKISECEVENEQ